MIDYSRNYKEFKTICSRIVKKVRIYELLSAQVLLVVLALVAESARRPNRRNSVGAKEIKIVS